MSESPTRLRSKLTARARAYRALLTPTGDMQQLADIVLADLAKVCYVNRTTAHADATAMHVAEGRRQVWLHIQAQLALTETRIQQLTQESPDS